jgi:multidrug resistance efflux pump
MITIFKPADVIVTVIDGDPPVDQSTLVASLQADLAAANASNAQLQAKIDAVRADAEARKAADAANVDGQNVLDITA